MISFANSGAKIGSTLRIRLPVQYTVSTTPALSLQNTVENFVSLPITNQYHVDFSFSSAELTLTIDDFSARYIEPAIAVLAARLESDFVNQMWPQVWNQVGTAGAAQTFKTVLQSRKLLLDNLTPQCKQWLLRINTQDNVDMVDSLKGLFQSTTEITQPIHRWRHGPVGRLRVGREYPPDDTDPRRGKRRPTRLPSSPIRTPAARSPSSPARAQATRATCSPSLASSGATQRPRSALACCSSSC